MRFIPTVALLALHPAYTAGMIATLSNISGGRIGLNIVTGWNSVEYEQMGLWAGSEFYEVRYEFAAEYLAILKDLWQTGKCNRKSKFWELKDCECFPTPEHSIPIVSAGQSPAGVDFCDKNVDQRFMFGHPDVLDELANQRAKGMTKKPEG